ncbi:MAG: aminotransferase class III-fold pyridoxal phosphate-dependent enzyme, partial [Desulfurococcaceae archaeon]
PVACAAALKVIEIMQRDKLQERAVRLGEVMKKRLLEMASKYRLIGDVRGLWVMQAIELVKDQLTKKPAVEETTKVIEKAREKGLLLLRAGLFLNAIRMHPPLTIEEELLNKGLDILDESLKEVEREVK